MNIEVSVHVDDQVYAHIITLQEHVGAAMQFHYNRFIQLTSILSLSLQLAPSEKYYSDPCFDRFY